MKALYNDKDCTRCGSVHKSNPVCYYENGVHCFSCGYTKTTHQWLAQERKHVFPEYFPVSTNNFDKFSLEAQMWLTQYCVDKKMIRKYNIRYCDDNSLIFPSFNEDGLLVCWQKRTMKDRFITTSGTKTPHFFKSCNNDSAIVVVEDFISGLRVCEAGWNSLCLWGTKISYEQIDEEFKKFAIFLVWLDNDASKQTNSGQEAAKKITKMAKHLLWKKYSFSFEKDVKNIVSDKDPKCFTSNKINKFILGALDNEQ